VALYAGAEIFGLDLPPGNNNYVVIYLKVPVDDYLYILKLGKF
jgi:hypothetical protein